MTTKVTVEENAENSKPEAENPSVSLGEAAAAVAATSAVVGEALGEIKVQELTLLQVAQETLQAVKSLAERMTTLESNLSAKMEIVNEVAKEVLEEIAEDLAQNTSENGEGDGGNAAKVADDAPEEKPIAEQLSPAASQGKRSALMVAFLGR